MDSSKGFKNNLQQHLSNLFNSSSQTLGNSIPATIPSTIPAQNSLVASSTISAESISTGPNPFTSHLDKADTSLNNNSDTNSKMDSHSRKKFSLSLNRKAASQNDISHSNPIILPSCATEKDPFVNPPKPISASRPENDTKTLKKIFSNTAQPSTSSVSKKFTNSTVIGLQEPHNSIDKQASNQSNTPISITSSSLVTKEDNSKKSRLIERKKDISDRICDFIFSGKFLPPLEFLKLQQEREEICGKLEQSIPSFQTSEIMNSTASHRITNTIPRDHSDASELRNTYNTDFASVYNSNAAFTSENIDFNAIGNQNTSTINFESFKDNIDKNTVQTDGFYLVDDEIITPYSNSPPIQPTWPPSSNIHREPTPQSSIASTSNKIDFAEIDNDVIEIDDSNFENLDDTLTISATQANPTVISVHYDMGAQNEELEPEYPWSKDVYEVLHKVFGLTKFRHNQLKAINATLRGDDVFVLMPTGGGKSLCYQLPALINSGYTQGVTIVVSPLLALVQDQVERLHSLGVHAFALNSDSNAEQKKHFFKDLSSPDPQIKLAYITPEMLNKSTAIRDLLRGLYEKQKLSRFVIDEAHCVSQWGHDFRPDYKQVGFVKTEYPNIPLLALTATANNQVKADVKQNLNILNCLTLVQSFNRKNLHYMIRKKSPKTVVSDIYSYITNNHPGSCGIIYCNSRRNCEELADELSGSYNLQASHYHAGLNKEDRQRIQRDWQNGVFKIIVATVAFGMGIDKPDVRFVIHHSLPHSMEGYYQETGRAGRDGRESECILFYNYADKKIIDYMIKKGEGDYDTKERQKNNLNRVVQFCENQIDCRRQQILAYFGENFDRAYCYGSCDNCITSGKTNYVQKDVTEVAKKLIKIVYLTQAQKITIRGLLLLFRGSACKKAKSYNLNSELLGCGKVLSLTDSERLVHDLISKNILKETSLYNRKGFASTYLFTGPSARSLLSGGIIVNMDFDEALNKTKPKVSKPIKSSNKRKLFQKNSETIPILPDSPNEPINLSSDIEENSDDYEDLRDDEYIYNNDSDADYIDEDFDGEPETPKSECTTQLKKLRTRIYTETKLPLYKIYTDTTLNSIIKHAPRSLEDLKQIENLPSDVISRYQNDILDITTKYANNIGLGSRLSKSRSKTADANVDDIQILATKTSNLSGFQNASSFAPIDLTGSTSSKSGTPKVSRFFANESKSLIEKFACPQPSVPHFDTIPPAKRVKANSFTQPKPPSSK